MPKLCTHETCTGCGACANACPRGCISMQADAEGFLRPTIDEVKCVDCGLCDRACPVLHFGAESVSGFPKAFAAHHSNETVLAGSSSGGVFTALAEQILVQGGTVYGAAFREDLSVAHLRVDTIAGLEALRGAKYLQSDTGDAYALVKQDLAAGRSVLFSGTPCQIAALRSFLGKAEEHLLCVDTVCHSVPSPMAWQSFLQDIRQQEGKAVRSVSFRDKRNGWQDYVMAVRLSDGSELLYGRAQNPYMKAFISGLSTRPSCHTCPFKGENRGADITLGDFWGVETACPNAFCRQGTSLIMIHTEKGMQVLDAVSGVLTLQPVDADAALAANSAYSTAFQPHRNRGRFFAELGTRPFTELAESLLVPTKQELRRQKWRRSLLYRCIQRGRRCLAGHRRNRT